MSSASCRAIKSPDAFLITIFKDLVKPTFLGFSKNFNVFVLDSKFFSILSVHQLSNHRLLQLPF